MKIEIDVIVRPLNNIYEYDIGEKKLKTHTGYLRGYRINNELKWVFNDGR